MVRDLGGQGESKGVQATVICQSCSNSHGECFLKGRGNETGFCAIKATKHAEHQPTAL